MLGQPERRDDVFDKSKSFIYFFQSDSALQWPQEKPCPKAWASLERVIEIQSKKYTHTQN